MTDPRAVICGASGFLGQALVDALREDGYRVAVIGRGSEADANWGDAAAIAEVVSGAELLINLAGKSVNARYTPAVRDEILRSRVDTTRQLREAVASVQRPPRLWMNASTATIYRHAVDRPQTERTGENGTGFSVNVAEEWEREFFAGDTPHTRRVALRLAIVLGDGAATRTLFQLARRGLGGTQYDGWWFPHRRYRGIGSRPTGTTAAHHRTRGAQRFSWVHVDDVIGSVRFIRDVPTLSGPINVVAPTASDNRSLMATLRRVVGVPVGIPVARFMLEPAMWVLRTEPELVMKSRWVQPELLLESGFEFTHTQLEPALAQVWSSIR